MVYGICVSRDILAIIIILIACECKALPEKDKKDRINSSCD